jgi:hypothetical protein
MFRARLTGARVANLSGVALAERSFAGDAPPGLHFVIRMHALRGDTAQTLAIRCLGDDPPAAGAHTIDPADGDCIAMYVRILVTRGGGAVLLERADAAQGTVTIETSQGGPAGFFSFQGTLLKDSDPVGTLTASGSFSAELLQESPSRPAGTGRAP